MLTRRHGKGRYCQCTSTDCLSRSPSPHSWNTTERDSRPDITGVDLQGRLANPAYDFGRVVERLPAILARPVRRDNSAAKPQRQRLLTPVEAEKLTQERVDGQTIDTLARQFGVHRTTVMAHLRRIGLPHE